MAWDDKVIWQEGMFMRAQHFQQQDRHAEARLQARVAPLQPHPWGVTELMLDRDLLAAGKFAVANAAGIMEDGTPFSLPGSADHPLPLELREGIRNQIIYLALPLRQPGNPEVGTDTAGESSRARYGLSAFEAYDTHSDATLPAELAVGRPRLRYLLENEERAGFTCLGLVRVVEVQADRRVVVDDRYIPPCLSIAACTALGSLASEFVGLLGQRGEALAARLAQPGTRGVAEITDFLLLQTINRIIPLLAHYADGGQLHPERFYAALVQLAGELATFSVRAERRASTYPGYRHDDLQRSFAPVVADLRRFCSEVVETTAVEIPLQERSHGVRVGPILDRTLLRAGQFVMTVMADMPGEHIRRLFPNQVKIGAVEHIRELVQVALPGIVVRPMPMAPRQIPFFAGAIYFELDRGSPHWQQMQTSGGFAIHVSGDFPGLKLSLWAIRA